SVAGDLSVVRRHVTDDRDFRLGVGRRGELAEARLLANEKGDRLVLSSVDFQDDFPFFASQDLDFLRHRKGRWRRWTLLFLRWDSRNARYRGEQEYCEADRSCKQGRGCKPC